MTTERILKICEHEQSLKQQRKRLDKQILGTRIYKDRLLAKHANDSFQFRNLRVARPEERYDKSLKRFLGRI